MFDLNRKQESTQVENTSSALPLRRTLVYYLFFQNFSWCNTFPAERSIFKHNSQQQRERSNWMPVEWQKNTSESNPAVKDLPNSLKSIRTACNRFKASNDLFSGCPSDWWLSHTFAQVAHGRNGSNTSSSPLAGSPGTCDVITPRGSTNAMSKSTCRAATHPLVCKASSSASQVEHPQHN